MSKDGSDSVTLILMKYSHFDRRALYIGIYRMILVFQFANDFDINSGENQKSSSDDSDLTMSLQVSAIHKLFKINCNQFQKKAIWALYVDEFKYSLTKSVGLGVGNMCVVISLLECCYVCSKGDYPSKFLNKVVYI